MQMCVVAGWCSFIYIQMKIVVIKKVAKVVIMGI